MASQSHIPNYYPIGFIEPVHLSPHSEEVPKNPQLPPEIIAASVGNVHREDRWWESELKDLSNQDANFLVLVLYYRFFDAKILTVLLQHGCVRGQLDKIYNCLFYKQPDDAREFCKLSAIQKVQALKGLMQPDWSAISMRWAPNEYAMRKAGDIATAIDKESNLAFGNVPFEGWLRHALGYRDDFVNAFFGQFHLLHYRLNRYLQSEHEERSKYDQVKEVGLVPIFLAFLTRY